MFTVRVTVLKAITTFRNSTWIVFFHRTTINSSRVDIVYRVHVCGKKVFEGPYSLVGWNPALLAWIIRRWVISTERVVNSLPHTGHSLQMILINTHQMAVPYKKNCACSLLALYSSCGAFKVAAAAPLLPQLGEFLFSTLTSLGSLTFSYFNLPLTLRRLVEVWSAKQNYY